MTGTESDPEFDEVQRRFRERVARDHDRLTALWRALAESRDDSAADPRWREASSVWITLFPRWAMAPRPSRR